MLPFAVLCAKPTDGHLCAVEWRVMLAGDLEQAVVHGHIEHVVLEDVQILSRRGHFTSRMLPSDIDGWLLVLLVNQSAVPWLLMRGHAVPVLMPHLP